MRSRRIVPMLVVVMALGQVRKLGPFALEYAREGLGWRVRFVSPLVTDAQTIEIGRAQSLELFGQRLTYRVLVVVEVASKQAPPTPAPSPPPEV